MLVRDPLIQLRDIRFAYVPDRVVLNGIGLTLSSGDRIGLIGANGSGKTTLLHIIMGLLRPSTGEVRAFGRVRQGEEDFFEVRTRTGFVFQDPEDQLFCPTVAEDVAFGPFNLGWDRDKVASVVRETLERLGLAGFENRVTHRLSYGEKRLVSLACVLSMQPDVLLLDEPNAGLDHDVEARLVRVLNDLDVALLVVSHDDALLSATTDRTLALEGGRLV